MAEPGLVCGVDEAGRGPLAGPVVAAAVILDPLCPIAGLDDSKRLSARAREKLEFEIKSQALAWAVAGAEVEEIDRLNILQATFLAMQRAVAALAVPPQAVWVDGNRGPTFGIPVRCIVGGDRTVAAIMAASILAKTARDAQMRVLDALHPQYGFARHKGYPTAGHIAALRAHGVSAVHRRSFAPVREVIVAAQIAPAPGAAG